MRTNQIDAILGTEQRYIDTVTNTLTFTLIPKLTPEESMISLPPVWMIVFNFGKDGVVTNFFLTKTPDK